MRSFEVNGSSDGGGMAKRMWSKFKNERALAVYSPFVVCLASGTLDPKSFLHCISQDVYFLQAFARAYELAEDYADDEEDKESIFELRKRVVKISRNQEALIQVRPNDLLICGPSGYVDFVEITHFPIKFVEWGFEPPGESACDHATVKYTEFLMETASGKVGENFSVKIVTPFEKTKLAAYTLSAISPCMRLYSFISKEIQAHLSPDEGGHIYKKWLDSLSSQKYEASASRIEDLLDKLSISLTGEELDVVERLYHRALKLELEFIWAQSVVQRTVVPFSQLHNRAEEDIVIFCDFDLTCTTIDSSAVLAELAIVTAMNDCKPARFEVASVDFRTTWSNLFSQYMEEYQQCIKSIIPDDDQSPQVEGLDYDGLCKALEQISNFEKRANSRLVHSNVLKGLNREDVRRAGEHLSFQDGCKMFFHDVLESKNFVTDVHVLSYCWCSDLIRSAFSSENLEFMNVHSNELVYKGSISTGSMIANMESPTDKLQAFKSISKCNIDSIKPLTVYIGGSIGDLLCLLEADVGIVIGSSTSLMRLGNRFGISFVPLFAGLVSKQRELAEKGVLDREGRSSILYTVSNWDEIYAFILGQ